MKQGCLVFLGTFVVSALLLGTFAYIILPESEVTSRANAAVILGLASGFFATLAVASLVEIAHRKREMASLQVSLSGVAPADGARVAAYGTLVADGPLLPAPLTGKPSVIYKYEIKVPQRKSDDRTVCEGYALTPCHIQTAAGPLRLLGYADLGFPAERLEGAEVRARAQAYFASTTVTPLGVGALREFTSMLLDDDGTIRSDTGLVPDVSNDRLRFGEHAIADGETLCAFGRYSAERGGLVPDPDSTDPYPIRLRRGDADAVRRTLVKSMIGYSVLALFMVALAAGAFFLARLVIVG